MPGWRITKDHITFDDFPDRTGTGRGTVQPEDIPFKLFDDDGELYYEGLISEDWLTGYAEKAFAPLDWAQADAGCTEMKFLNKKGEWEQL